VKRLPFNLILLVSTILIAGLLIASALLGSVPLNLAKALDFDTPSIDQTILLNLRLPRALLAIVVGGALGATGAAYQALFRNPLADPFIVGSSSGAAVGAVMMIVLGFASIGGSALGAFAGALLAVWFVYGYAAVRRLPSVSLLLVGSTLGTMLGAVVWLLLAIHDQQLPRTLSWLLGGLAGVSWWTVACASACVLLSLIALILLGKPLDAAVLGDDVATSLGYKARSIALWTLLAGSIAVAAAVASAGIVGFVGLIAPHLARPLVGGTQRRTILLSALLGSALVQSADLLARTVVAPIELPLGVVTAVIGGPVFLWVLGRSKLLGARTP
jgi:iron complex transport system permease protein